MKVKIARIKRGLTQKQLRQKLVEEYSLGISPNTLVQIEKGNYDNVTFGLMKKIANTLSEDVKDLFFED
ncbi:helix-turn-helix transcriptional regulator [Clostridium tunisiense]|uniref:helix-turn-helix transcriptional regulator n=1 Tax=Clostridium tunisiense TaxID=219748 RepID=UPI0002DA8F8D|nr:helix-turn-helix domain-containing protein [Clostridium tunisiense]